MKSIDNHEVALNLVYYKWLRLYKVFDPNSQQIFNYNLFRFFGIIYIIFVQCSFVFGSLGFFLETNHTYDITAQMSFWYFVICNASCTLKFIVIIYKATDMWNLLNVLEIKFFKSKSLYCLENTKTLKENKTKISQFTIYFLICLFIIFLLWVTYPLIINTSKKLNENPNELYNNILSLWYPVTIKIYNQFFYFFYFFEFGIMLYYIYSLLVDNFLICLGLIIAIQSKILTQAFANIGRQVKPHTVTKVYGKIIS